MEDPLAGLFEHLTDADRRAAVWCACVCARTALHLAPPGAPAHAIETAEAWIRGEASEADCRHAATHALDLDVAASSVAAAVLDPAACYTAAHAAATSVAHATLGLAAPPRQLERARRAQLRRLAHTVETTRWPRTVPTGSQLQRSPEAIQVAWDQARTHPPTEPDLSIEALIDARARAAAWGLDWHDPVQRAVAEQPSDSADVRRLLGVAPDPFS